MRWDLSFCEAEIEGNELIVQLNENRKSIERLFKVYGKYYKLRSILENFGYNIFRKALKKRILTLNPDRIEHFKNFFDAIQIEETKTLPLSEQAHIDPSPAKPWQVEAGEKVPTKREGMSFCTKCGAKLPEGLDDGRFCPICGAPIVSWRMIFQMRLKILQLQSWLEYFILHARAPRNLHERWHVKFWRYLNSKVLRE